MYHICPGDSSHGLWQLVLHTHLLTYLLRKPPCDNLHRTSGSPAYPQRQSLLSSAMPIIQPKTGKRTRFLQTPGMEPSTSRGFRPPCKAPYDRRSGLLNLTHLQRGATPRRRRQKLQPFHLSTLALFLKFHPWNLQSPARLPRGTMRKTERPRRQPFPI
jgi:hypothetical protein